MAQYIIVQSYHRRQCIYWLCAVYYLYLGVSPIGINTEPLLSPDVLHYFNPKNGWYVDETRVRINTLMAASSAALRAAKESKETIMPACVDCSDILEGHVIIGFQEPIMECTEDSERTRNSDSSFYGTFVRYVLTHVMSAGKGTRRSLEPIIPKINSEEKRLPIRQIGPQPFSMNSLFSSLAHPRNLAEQEDSEEKSQEEFNPVSVYVSSLPTIPSKSNAKSSIVSSIGSPLMNLAGFMDALNNVNMGNVLCGMMPPPELNGQSLCVVMSTLAEKLACRSENYGICATLKKIDAFGSPENSSNNTNSSSKTNNPNTTGNTGVNHKGHPPINSADTISNNQTNPMDHNYYDSLSTIISSIILPLHNKKHRHFMDYTTLPLIDFFAEENVTKLPRKIPPHIVKLEGPTYQLIWQALMRLDDLWALTHCQIPLHDIPILPGWKTELKLHGLSKGVPVDSSSHMILVARRDNDILILCRSTKTHVEWRLNMQTTQQFSWLNSWEGAVHEGFAHIYQSVWPAIEIFLGQLERQGQLNKVIVAGFSLGGAIAAITSYAISLKYPKRVHAVLYGTPRVGDEDFSSAWAKRINGRVLMYAYDPIPKVPCKNMPDCRQYPNVPIVNGSRASLELLNQQNSGKLFMNQIKNQLFKPWNDLVYGGASISQRSKSKNHNPVSGDSVASMESNDVIQNASHSNSVKNTNNNTQNNINTIPEEANAFKDLPITLPLPAVVYYADFYAQVEFTQNDMPNPKDQNASFVTYNHICAYSCWLATTFNKQDHRTQCKVSGMAITSEAPLPDDVCPSLIT